MGISMRAARQAAVSTQERAPHRLSAPAKMRNCSAQIVMKHATQGAVASRRSSAAQAMEFVPSKYQRAQVEGTYVSAQQTSLSLQNCRSEESVCRIGECCAALYSNFSE